MQSQGLQTSTQCKRNKSFLLNLIKIPRVSIKWRLKREKLQWWGKSKQLWLISPHSSQNMMKSYLNPHICLLLCPLRWGEKKCNPYSMRWRYRDMLRRSPQSLFLTRYLQRWNMHAGKKMKQRLYCQVAIPNKCERRNSSSLIHNKLDKTGFLMDLVFLKTIKSISFCFILNSFDFDFSL